jgi:hypothetical protein
MSQEQVGMSKPRESVARFFFLFDSSARSNKHAQGLDEFLTGPSPVLATDLIQTYFDRFFSSGCALRIAVLSRKEMLASPSNRSTKTRVERTPMCADGIDYLLSMATPCGLGFAEGLIINFEKFLHFRNPSRLDKVNVVRMSIVGLVALGRVELHRQTKIIGILFAGLPKALEILDGRNRGQFPGGLEKVAFGL